ncbi:MAG: hypothetical protein K6U10_00305 [Acidobacteriia bacterium]|nr:hypothetical protein [Methyloceanibacter sp.]MCL6490244.1 hypothetical protein [Terriglobia bacterium]
MSFSVNTNLAALTALQVLNDTEQQLNQTQNVISTGQSVSTAQDNPAIYSIAQTMNANIAGLSAVQSDLAFAQSVLTTASNASTQISSQLAYLQQTVTQGEQSGISAATIDSQINNILNNINAFANNATFNGVNLLATASTPGVQQTSLSIVDSINDTNPVTVNSQITGANANIVQQLGLSNLSVASTGVQISFSSSYTPAAGDYLQLSNGTNNWIFEFQTSGSAPVAAPTGYVLGANGSGGTNYLVNVTVSSTASPMQYIGALITSLQQQGFGASLDNSGNLTITGNNISYQNSGGTAQISGFVKTGTAYSATIATQETGTTASGLAAGQGALTLVQNAINNMNNIAATIGSAQQEVTGLQNFASSLSSALTEGVGALTDANMAAESARLASLQTKQQLGIQSLSMANARPQLMLQLFR